MTIVPGRSGPAMALAAAALIAGPVARPGATVSAQVMPAQGSGSGQASPGIPIGAAISGVVVDAVSGQPLAGAAVSLNDLDNRLNVVPRALTDARGRFVFRQLKPSKGYYLGAQRFGYAYTRYGWSAPGQSLTIADIARIAVTDGQWISNLSIPLWRLAVINGRVVDERGEPVVGVAVRAFTTRRISGQPQLVGGPIATTDDRGVYRLVDLDPGRYVVAVLSVQSTVLSSTPEFPITRAIGELATGGIGAGRGASVSAPGIDVGGRHRLIMSNFATPPPPEADHSRAYPPLFHPAARQITEATPFDLKYGDNLAGIDFQLQPVPVVRLSGRLIAPSGSVPGLLLRLMPAGSERLGFGSEAATTTVDRDGTFTFLNVPEGNYTLLAQASVMDFTTGSTMTRFPDAPGFPGGSISVGSLDGAPGLSYLARSGQPGQMWARTSISVGQQDIDDLIVQLRPTIAIRGRIALDKDTKSDGRLHLTAEPVDGNPTLGQPSGGTNPNDPSRTFTIEGLLGGRYVLRMLSNLAIMSVMSAGRDVRDTGFDATAGRDFDDVIVTLTDKYAEIQGTVHGRPGAVAGVLVFPAERDQWTNYGWRPARFRTTRAGPTGSFQLGRLPAGHYFLVAIDPARLEGWTDPQFLAAASIRAIRITLGWGDRKTQDLTYTDIRVK